MDLATISQELNKRFLAPLPEFYKRRIIVWYDEEEEFEDQIGELELQDRMMSYLYNVKPRNAELVVDEMLYYGLSTEEK